VAAAETILRVATAPPEEEAAEPRTDEGQ
jgi:hypothetical protein